MVKKGEGVGGERFRPSGAYWNQDAIPPVSDHARQVRFMVGVSTEWVFVTH